MSPETPPVIVQIAAEQPEPPAAVDYMDMLAPDMDFYTWLPVPGSDSESEEAAILDDGTDQQHEPPAEVTTTTTASLVWSTGVSFAPPRRNPRQRQPARPPPSRGAAASPPPTRQWTTWCRTQAQQVVAQTHTSQLLPGPEEHQPTCFAFAVHQVASDGKPKVRRAEDWRCSFANATVAADGSPPSYRQLPALGPAEDDQLADSSFTASRRLCEALGFTFKQSKEQPPAPQQTIQGVSISVTDDSITVQGTEDRRRRLDESLADVLTQDRLRPHDAASLAGKLQFYCQALRGRSHAAALRPLFRRAQLTGAGRDNNEWRLNGQLRHGIGLLRWSLRHAPPKVIPFRQEAHSVLYADAFFNLFDKDWKPADQDIPSWDERLLRRSATAGALWLPSMQGTTFFAHGHVPYWFVREFASRRAYIYMLEIVAQLLPILATFFAHGHVPYWFVREFASRRAYIYMLEIVAQLLPILAMHEQLDRYIIMFVDNEPARHALSTGFGKDDSINCLLQHSWRFLEEKSLHPAWQRVTSKANVSDDVSRGDLRHARAEGWTEVKRDWDPLFEKLLRGSERFRASGVL
eukprot:s436_g4.t1